MSAFISCVSNAMKTFEFKVCRCLTNLQWAMHPRGKEFCPAYDLHGIPSEATENDDRTKEQTRSPLKDLIGDGFLWAVPKFRRTIERRRIRWLAEEKRIKPKGYLIACVTCGHFHEARTICGNCYEKVRAETNAIREAIDGEWKCDAIDKDVAVVYQNDPKNEQFWQGKRIVEMKRERPQWFHPNLQQRTNQTSDDATSTSLHPSKSILTQVK